MIHYVLLPSALGATGLSFVALEGRATRLREFRRVFLQAFEVRMPWGCIWAESCALGLACWHALEPPPCVPALLESHQFLPLCWRQQGPYPQHCLQALLADGKLQSANGVGLLHHCSFLWPLLGEQRAHLGLRLA
jgi:hypothetical protein